MKSIQNKLKFLLIIKLSILITCLFYFNYIKISKNNFKELLVSFNLIQRKNISIFCFIKTHRDNFKTRLIKSYLNCIQYCTDYRYVTAFDNQTLNLNYKFLFPANYVKENYGKLTDKVYGGFLAIKTLPLFDWYLYADDDTFINVKNLKLFLDDKNSSEPVQFGRYFGAFDGYLSGGAGFVFSQEAYKRLVNKLSRNYSSCQNTGIDDLDLSKCLLSVNVSIGESRDKFGLHRFISTDFEKAYFGPIDMNSYDKYKQDHIGRLCCSTSWISFHEKNHLHFDNMSQIIHNLLLE